MKKLFPFFLLAAIPVLFSCTKEYSTENTLNGGDPGIIGSNCRISKIVYADPASGVGIGSIAAIINTTDQATDVTRFDSVGAQYLSGGLPVYNNDTIYINGNEYFLTDIPGGRVAEFHGLTDINNPLSQFVVNYNYNAAGYLTSKTYQLASSPGTSYLLVNYTYTGNNITHMTANNVVADVISDLVSDADITYYTNILPNRFIYLFPDENTYADYTQFLNFGNKPNNAVQSLKVRNYNPGNVVKDSAVSTFSTYILSRDNYVLSTIMAGNDQPSIPVAAGKLTFSYHCK